MLIIIIIWYTCQTPRLAFQPQTVSWPWGLGTYLNVKSVCHIKWHWLIIVCSLDGWHFISVDSFRFGASKIAMCGGSTMRTHIVSPSYKSYSCKIWCILVKWDGFYLCQRWVAFNCSLAYFFLHLHVVGVTRPSFKCIGLPVSLEPGG